MALHMQTCSERVLLPVVPHTGPGGPVPTCTRPPLGLPIGWLVVADADFVGRGVGGGCAVGGAADSAADAGRAATCARARERQEGGGRKKKAGAGAKGRGARPPPRDDASRTTPAAAGAGRWENREGGGWPWAPPGVASARWAYPAGGCRCDNTRRCRGHTRASPTAVLSPSFMVAPVPSRGPLPAAAAPATAAAAAAKAAWA